MIPATTARGTIVKPSHTIAATTSALREMVLDIAHIGERQLAVHIGYESVRNVAIQHINSSF